MFDLVRHAGLFHRGDRIAAADDGDGGGILGHRLRDAGGAAGKGRHFKDAHRPVPDDGARPGDFCRNSSTVAGPISSAIQPAGNGPSPSKIWSCVGRKFVGQHVSTGNRKRTPLLFGFFERFAATSSLSASTSDLPTSCPLALRKVYAMPPPTRSASTLLNRLWITSILSETLAPPRIATKGFSGFQGFAQDSAPSPSAARPRTVKRNE